MGAWLSIAMLIGSIVMVAQADHFAAIYLLGLSILMAVVSKP